MSQKTMRKQLLYKSSLSNSDNNIERNRSSHKKINKRVHYSTSGLKKEPNGYKELSTKEHTKVMSAATVSPQNPNEITKKKEYGSVKNNRHRAQQDLEIMKIFTSPEWSKKTFHESTNSIVNSMVNNDDIPLIHKEVEKALSKVYNEAESMEYLYPIQETEETEETDNVEEKHRIKTESSFNSIQQSAETEEKELENTMQESIKESIIENRNSIKSFEGYGYTEHEHDMTFETPEGNILAYDFESYMTPNVEVPDKSLRESVDNSDYVCNEEDVHENQIGVEYESYSNRECCEEQETVETSTKCNSEVSIPNSSSKEELLDEEALRKYFNFDGLSDSSGSSSDPSNTVSLNTDVMTRIIRQNKTREYMTEKQMSNESAAFTEAMDLIFEETKAALGTLLVEGLCIVSKRHRQNSFKYLGKWLLIQADIRDENQTEEESMMSSYSSL